MSGCSTGSMRPWGLNIMGLCLKGISFVSGCSIGVVRIHGVDIARVQISAPRHRKNSPADMVSSIRNNPAN